MSLYFDLSKKKHVGNFNICGCRDELHRGRFAAEISQEAGKHRHKSYIDVQLAVLNQIVLICVEEKLIEKIN